MHNLFAKPILFAYILAYCDIIVVDEATIDSNIKLVSLLPKKLYQRFEPMLKLST